MYLMIELIKISNYRIFKELDFRPTKGMNIIVGDNEAGKSTLLEAMELALTGRISGRWASDELNPFWFNQDILEDFWNGCTSNKKVSPPSIRIEVYFTKNYSSLQKKRGRINSAQEDCPGFSLRVEVDPQYLEEFNDYIKDPKRPDILPTEYYRVIWEDFSGATMSRRPKDFRVARVDSQSLRSRLAVDYHARQMLIDMIDEQESAHISVAYRQLRHELTSDALNVVNQSNIAGAGASINRSLTLAMDQSASSSWHHSVVPHVSEVPFNLTGQGTQSLVKMSLALDANATNANVVLIEEPENHLSHTSLFDMLNLIKESIRDTGNQQLFVTTHSSFVLNRLGLDNLRLLHQGTVASFKGLSEDTRHYFELQPGFDTLRVVLAKRLVIVEGPSDELIFMTAYKDTTGREPHQDGIDIVTMGIRNRRALELCKLLDRSVAVLRDVDDQTPEHWRNKVKDYLKKGKRQMFIGDHDDGHTLEPQMITANENSLDEFAKVIGMDSNTDRDQLRKYMTDHKTEWAWRVATSDVRVDYPQYIRDAIDFVRSS